ncbi:MAG TPA: 50S ribosomal protein L23 [Patescibacteria group bacterium]|nr:50S ribosomal protein L23 [Patescibacteria group bacterium]
MNIIIRPIITEQSMQGAEKGRFSFVVARSADKKQIRQMISEKFSVTPVAIMTTIVKGKTKRVGKMRQKTTASAFKKAVVQLKAGEKISLFELGA